MTVAVPRVRFPEISSRAWEHPADRGALTTLRTLQGFDVVLKTLSGLLRERQYRLLFLSTAARVDERQFERLHRLRAECVEILDAPETPELYVTQNPAVNAFTIGMDRPFIVVTTGLIDLLELDETRFVIGHELGHALSGHAVNRTILMYLMQFLGSFGWLPVGGWALRAIIAALMEWQRKSELSGDRAGLLCAQDLDVAVSVQLKLAGGSHVEQMNTAAFLEQAAEYDATGDLRDGVLKLLNVSRQTHPFSVLRAAELQKWVDSGAYQEILDGDYPRRGDDHRTSVREEVRGAARSYRDSFDQSQDPLMRTLRDIGGGVGSAATAFGQGVSDIAADIGRRFSAWRDPAAPTPPEESEDAPTETDTEPDGDGTERPE